MSFTSAIQAARKAARAVAGVDVVYYRGEQEIPLCALVGKTDYEREDPGGPIVQSQLRDYLVAASDLVLDEAVFLPEIGDRIEETIEGETHTFEVAPLNGNQNCWRYSDPGRTELRIHVQEVAAEDE